MRIGPLTLSYNIDIGTAIEICLLVIALAKFLRHVSRIDDRVAALWKAMNGEGPQDEQGWFYRLAVIENKVNEMWERLQFGKALADRRTQEQRSQK